MPLYLNQTTVTVIRQGRRVKVQPSKPSSPRPYDFTDEEAAAAEAAGAVMLPYKRPPAVPAPEPEGTSEKSTTKAETAAEKKARERAEAAAAKAAPDDDSL